MTDLKVERIGEVKWRIEASGKMRTDGIFYASGKLVEVLWKDNSLRQVANVATLPGIVGNSLAMPDIHSGYGFPIGGVAAFDEDEGIVSPGGVGYDINCGVRMVTTNLQATEVQPHLSGLVEALFDAVPSGVGSRSSYLRLSSNQMDQVLIEGAAAAVAMGYGSSEDLLFLESGGVIPGADPKTVSKKARERGQDQLGTLGSGNHFLEIDKVVQIFDPEAAVAFGLKEGQIVLQVHTGSRGLGHQVCDDAVGVMGRVAARYGIELPDRQLACAPLHSKEAQEYLAAMAAAANFAFANRHVVMHLANEAMRKYLKAQKVTYRSRVLYDVAHNIAKWEMHEGGRGGKKRLLVHRKGATRAFGPGHPEVPAPYREVGQPVLIPGDMARASYILAGTQNAMRETFGSSCHGAGRILSRSQAKRMTKAGEVLGKLKQKGIWVKVASRETVTEETPEAYKDVSEVVDVVAKAGIAKVVAKLEPLAIVKG